MDRVRLRSRLLKALCFILALGLGTGHAQPKVCSPADADAAEAAVNRLDSWTKVERIFKQFGHCDGGSIAEGNSEAVARLLVDHWAELPVLAELIKHDPAVKRFILRHIDTTLDTGDLDSIAKLASSKCPKGSATLCSELRQAAARSAK